MCKLTLLLHRTHAICLKAVHYSINRFVCPGHASGHNPSTSVWIVKYTLWHKPNISQNSDTLGSVGKFSHFWQFSVFPCARWCKCHDVSMFPCARWCKCHDVSKFSFHFSYICLYQNSLWCLLMLHVYVVCLCTKIVCCLEAQCRLWSRKTRYESVSRCENKKAKCYILPLD